MGTLLLAMNPVLEPLGQGIEYDVAAGPFIAAGIGVILIIGFGIVFSTVIIVKFFLKRRASQKTDESS
ncbi:MAG: hypothetical protein TUN42_08310 [Dehalogenimonas sp.]